MLLQRERWSLLFVNFELTAQNEANNYYLVWLSFFCVMKLVFE